MDRKPRERAYRAGLSVAAGVQGDIDHDDRGHLSADALSRGRVRRHGDRALRHVLRSLQLRPECDDHGLRQRNAGCGGVREGGFRHLGHRHHRGTKAERALLRSLFQRRHDDGRIERRGGSDGPGKRRYERLQRQGDRETVWLYADNRRELLQDIHTRGALAFVRAGAWRRPFSSR